MKKRTQKSTVLITVSRKRTFCNKVIPYLSNDLNFMKLAIFLSTCASLVYIPGMGKSIALALLKHGAEVIVMERMKETLQKFKEEVRNNFSNVIMVVQFMSDMPGLETHQAQHSPQPRHSMSLSAVCPGKVSWDLGLKY